MALTLKGIAEQLYEIYGFQNQHDVMAYDVDGNECSLYDLKKLAAHETGYFLLGRNKRKNRVIRRCEEDGGAGEVVFTIKGPRWPVSIKEHNRMRASLV